MIGPLIQTMRPRQWTKNLLVFAGVVFARKLGEFPMVARAAEGFVVFCVLSGVVYIINDATDAESDKAHPAKRNRPLASGHLSVRSALSAAAALGVASIAGAFAIGRQFGLCASIYFALMLAYSLFLKHVVILDLMLLALGFVLRAVAGVWAIRPLDPEGVPLTSWFLACTFFLALFLAICKRRHELLLLEDQAQNHRPVLEEYSPALLDKMVSVATAATVISYAMYATSHAVPGASVDSTDFPSMIYTLPFVVYGIFRYLYQVYRKEEGGAPETVLLTDKAMIANIVLWFLTVLYILHQ